MKTFFTKVFTLLLFALLSCNILFAQVGSYTSYTSTGPSNYNVEIRNLRDCASLEICSGCANSSNPSPCYIKVYAMGGVLPSGVPHNIPASSAAYAKAALVTLL